LSDATVYLVDVDNTLLDNDTVLADLKQHLIDTYGEEQAQRYWAIVDDRWKEVAYADYLGALQRFRRENPCDTRLLDTSRFMIEYPFASHVFPGAIEALHALKRRGRVVILTDGDIVWQPRKVRQSGLWDAVDGNVLVYIHKEEMLADIERHFPAGHYVMVDDKIRIHAAMKPIWGERLTTVFVRQGRYALDASLVAQYPPADVTIQRIADVAERL
jgi:FMN phosphatase YigB (HAD superfamily)